MALRGEVTRAREVVRAKIDAKWQPVKLFLEDQGFDFAPNDCLPDPPGYFLSQLSIRACVCAHTVVSALPVRANSLSPPDFCRSALAYLRPPHAFVCMPSHGLLRGGPRSHALVSAHVLRVGGQSMADQKPNKRHCTHARSLPHTLSHGPLKAITRSRACTQVPCRVHALGYAKVLSPPQAPTSKPKARLLHPASPKRSAASSRMEYEPFFPPGLTWAQHRMVWRAAWTRYKRTWTHDMWEDDANGTPEQQVGSHPLARPNRLSLSLVLSLRSSGGSYSRGETPEPPIGPYISLALSLTLSLALGLTLSLTLSTLSLTHSLTLSTALRRLSTGWGLSSLSPKDVSFDRPPHDV